MAGDISDPQTIAAIITPDTDSIFHLAAIVSAQAETDFDLGKSINIDATRAMLERIRTLGTRPRMVFTNSAAVFGVPLPDIVPDPIATLPQSTTDTKKHMKS